MALPTPLRCFVPFFALAASALAAATPARPNIVFMLLDNVGQEWFGCYGSEERCTPNIDRLAATGVRVENCYASPVCGPSRTMLLTGRYPHRTGFVLHHDAALYRGRRNGRDVAGGLYTLTEAGGNVVLIANAPARIRGGRTLPLADFTDLYPTLCELTGAPVPREHAVDGRSFAGFLLGPADARPHRGWILNEYHDVRVVRDTRYKLYSDGRFFDAETDPAEQHDLKAVNGPDVAAARRRLQQVLALLPADTPPPFLLRSQSGFKLRNSGRKPD